MTQSTMGGLISRILGGPSETSQIAARLFAKLVSQARQPVFFQRLGVPDTVDGRFDMVAMHAFLVFHRLKGQGGRAAELAQALYDVVFRDMEASLRQLGAGDVGVGKRIRVMTEALQGRITAYETALNGNPLEVEGAVRRNLYGTADPDPEAVRAMANYLRQASEMAGRQPVDRVLRGLFDFPPPPAATGENQAQSYEIG
ncbi:MAG: ubiquinol-cytochrome C chaperone [Rhodospirillaceae bacterium]|nr:ubiquinol-cytochrome C chaperone [Rhodospirillaceae bacterium]